MARAAAAVAILCAASLTRRAQLPEVPPAESRPTAIRGWVVADDSGAPIPNARIAIGGVETFGARVLVPVDEQGRFAWTPPKGPYRLTVSKAGYASQQILSTKSGPPAEIRLCRAATISGRVMDDAGQPIVSARVSLHPWSDRPIPFTEVATADTDDRGEYRLGGLAEGTYVVGVGNMPVARVLTERGDIGFVSRARRVYYPFAFIVEQGQPLPIRSGDERTDIDFVIRTPPSAAPGPRTLSPTTSPPTGIIRGRVSSLEGRALSDALVELSQVGGRARAQLARTADDGRFEFGEVANGTFHVLASKPGFASVSANGSRVPPSARGETVDVRDGRAFDRVDMRLARWSTMSGRIVDEHGDPLQGARVQLLQIRYQLGRRQLVPGSAPIRVTDDRGVYRLFYVPPGDYLVSAAIGDIGTGEVPGYARTYFPGTIDPTQARLLSVSWDEELPALDFAIAPAPTARVSGRLLDAAGEPTTGGRLTLTPDRRAAFTASTPAGARILPSGAFEFANVTSGTYVIQAYRGRSDNSVEGEFGALPVTVGDADVTDLILQTSVGSRISGSVAFESLDPSHTIARSGVEISPIPADYDRSPTEVARAKIHPDWTFEIGGVSGPRRLQVSRAPEGWGLKEIRVNGFDITDQPVLFGRPDQSLADVHVVLTDRISQLTGTVSDDRGRPSPGTFVIVFPIASDQRYPSSRYLRIATAGADGGYAIAGLPSGTYHVAATPRIPAGEDAWQDPRLLDSLVPRAMQITLSEGLRQVVNVRVASR